MDYNGQLAQSYEEIYTLKNSELKVVFLGGIGEIGKNMTAIEYGDDIVVIDGGLSFPTADMPGVDLVIPDYTYLKQNKHRICAFLITHGHEDHIGALPYILEDIKAPVYATKLTLALLEHKLMERNMDDYELIPVEYSAVEKIGGFSVKFIKMSHSIAGAVSLAIETPKGIIFHTGDYKIDFSPIDDRRMDLGEIAQVGNKGVLLMLGESTNVEREGYSMSESKVGESLDKIFSANIGRRIIVATFASNIHRMQQIIDLADKYGRRVCFVGRSMENISHMAIKIGELKPHSEFVPMDKANSMPPERLVIVCTGSQGEPMSALTRMASDNSRIKVGQGDTIIVSSTPIPGNEKSVYNVINNLYRKGARVIYESLAEIHASGHAYREEMKTMFSLLKPKYFIPVHGEYRHLAKHKELAEQMGVPSANCMIAEIGDVISIKRKGLTKVAQVPAGQLYIDGPNIDDVSGSLVLKDRLHLSEDGFMVVLLNLSIDKGGLSSPPEIIMRGVNLNDDMLRDAVGVAEDTIAKLGVGKHDNRAEIKEGVRKALKKYLAGTARQYPIIIPVVMEH